MSWKINYLDEKTFKKIVWLKMEASNIDRRDLPLGGCSGLLSFERGDCVSISPLGKKGNTS